MNQRNGENLPEKSATSPAREYNLERRTAQFAKDSINFAKGIRRDVINNPLIRQFIRSSTSIGANYCEADEAESGKEFRYRIGICKREARETKHNIRMLVAAQPEIREEAKVLWQEAKEFTLIFAAILRSK